MMRPHRLVLSLSTLLASRALVSTTTPAAHAEVWSHRDASGDVVRVVQGGGNSSESAAPEDRDADVRRVDIAHTSRTVRVAVRVRDMTRGGQFGRLHLRMPGGVEVMAEVAREGRDTTFLLMPVSEDEMAGCADASGRFRPKRNLMVVRIARSCLGDPRWVRVGVAYGTLEGSRARSRVFHVDDGLRDRGYSVARLPGWSPRVAVG
ncbi:MULTISPECIES: hypothetical protein [unclassified Nocardioides]|uniref:hypothetical protein n=1 Tax=unclassified Nocardioides TaxID=2615069 RepID=UPI00301544EB